MNDMPYAMTFANYTGTSPVLKNASAIIDTVRFQDATNTTDTTDTATDETDTETEAEDTTSESEN